MIGVLVDDLLLWHARGLNPSGIQRVESELLRTGRLRPGLAFVACTLTPDPADPSDPHRTQLTEVPWGRLKWTGPPPTPVRRPLHRRVASRAIRVAKQLPYPAPLRRVLRAAYRAVRPARPAPGPARGPRTVQPDVLLVAGNFWRTVERAQRIRAIAERGIPVRVVVYDVFPILSPEWFEPGMPATFTAAFDEVIPVADRIVTMSAATAEALQARYPAAASRIVVAVPTLRAHARAGELPPEAVDVEAPFVLAVGTVEPRKNIAGLVRAWQLAREDPALAGASLVIAGRRGWQSGALEDEIAAIGPGQNIRRLPKVTDAQIEWLYDNCAALVTPSWAEGFGLPAREAVARGVPTLISTGIPADGLDPDRFEDFEPGETDTLAALLRKHLLSPAGRRTDVELGSGTGWEPMLDALVR